MAKSTKKRKTKKKIHRNRRKHWLLRRWTLLLILMVSLLGAGFYLKEKIGFYYAMYFNQFEHKKLKNSKKEEERIHKIVEEYVDKTFGIDISHYQEVKDIQWDSLSIAHRSIPLKFVVMRATMGNRGKDKNFNTFWRLAREHQLVRGAYHFYRPDEDPVRQANNFLETVKLEEGDLVPVLDIEKKSLRYSHPELIENLKTWCKIVEEKYGRKPIIYTYYHYYKDYLRGEFDDYPLWLANYNDVLEPSVQDLWKMWQFTEKGIVYGINTKVDLNVYNGSFSSFKKLTLQE